MVLGALGSLNKHSFVLRVISDISNPHLTDSLAARNVQGTSKERSFNRLPGVRAFSV